MLICHELVVSNEAAALQACHVSYMHGTSAVSTMPARLSAAGRLLQLMVHLWSLKHHHSAATHHHHYRCKTQLSYPLKLHACRANTDYFLYIFCSMYLVLFSIVLYRTIVTVYTDNIFQYNYLWQFHQLIHLSPVGCFTPARGKNRAKKSPGKWG